MSRNIDLVDVSIALGPGLPVWPGSPGARVRQLQQLRLGDPVNASCLECDVHVGTHVDAPSHFIDGGATVEQLRLAVLVGPAWVADLGDVTEVDEGALEAAAIPVGTMRLLLRTGNSRLWHTSSSFVPSYAGLTAGAAAWLVDRGVELVGIDYLSIQRYGDPPDVHTILLSAGIVIVEGLDLSGVAEGSWELICMPLKLIGAEAAPARVVLRHQETS